MSVSDINNPANEVPYDPKEISDKFDPAKESIPKASAPETTSLESSSPKVKELELDSGAEALWDDPTIRLLLIHLNLLMNISNSLNLHSFH